MPVVHIRPLEFDETAIDLSDVSTMKTMFKRLVRSIETQFSALAKHFTGLGDEAVKRAWML